MIASLTAQEFMASIYVVRITPKDIAGIRHGTIASGTGRHQAEAATSTY